MLQRNYHIIRATLLRHDHNNAPLFSFQRVLYRFSPHLISVSLLREKGQVGISLSPFLSLRSFWEISKGLLDFLKLHVLKLCRINITLYSGRLVPHHSSSGGGSNMNSGKDLLTVNSNASIEMQLRSRRKAAKMLVVVVIVFAVCYFPVHLVSILR